jgi:hypothetical protein
LFGHLPEQAGEEGGLKGCPELDFFVGDDFVNQKTHPEREEKGNEIFQYPLKDRADVDYRLKSVTLKEGDGRGENHTHQEKDAGQQDHQQIDRLPSEDTSAPLDLKDNIERGPQRAEHPGGGPDEPSDAQDPHNFSIPDDLQDVPHNPWI